MSWKKLLRKKELRLFLKLVENIFIRLLNLKVYVEKTPEEKGIATYTASSLPKAPREGFSTWKKLLRKKELRRNDSCRVVIAFNFNPCVVEKTPEEKGIATLPFLSASFLELAPWKKLLRKKELRLQFDTVLNISNKFSYKGGKNS